MCMHADAATHSDDPTDVTDAIADDTDVTIANRCACTEEAATHSDDPTEVIDAIAGDTDATIANRFACTADAATHRRH